MSRLQSFTALILSSFTLGNFSCVATADDSIGLKFSQAFLGTCVQDFPDTNKIKAAAKALAWKEITDPNVKAMLGPSDPSAMWQGWMMQTGDSKYFVGISEGQYEGKKIHNCNLAQDRTDVDGIIAELERLLNTKKISETIEAGQRYGTWEFERSGESFLLMIVDGTPMNFDLINASITTDFRAK
jgi:hypothetical protein